MRLLVYGFGENLPTLLEKYFGGSVEFYLSPDGLTEALAALERFSFDGIVIDNDNPDIDGIDLVALVRNVRFAGTGSNVPVIVATSDQDESALHEYRQSGVDKFVTAPFDETAMTDILNYFRSGNGAEAATVNNHHVDPEAVKARLECDDDFLVDLWETFLEEAPLLREGLAMAIAVADQSGAERRAHSIKGIAGNVGADGLRAISFEIEKSAREGDMKRVAELFPELELSLDYVIEEIMALIASR
ncbi:aerobic respiration control sensor protein ArcB [Geobacter sp. OR-1]|uniref:Hpt domain-containing response regulator n=1 Tax=Geobacter sp. OR-1 TaxID=1266765 RepID=UPI000542304E|nr:response regulator [Geobacter sp. OR-1]GAM08804.1 aerobic respiration control sensor protein ArcB [Geobacter sp. OR-1]